MGSDKKEGKMEKTQGIELLKKVLNNPDAEFRDGQWEAIDSVANKNKKITFSTKNWLGKKYCLFFIYKNI